ncbi:MAG: hypothetical protein methR_P3174 [Methyloprofundus sp.]|nr:MAG: hypothetical protein methR_P3174 [Methyloprofundus sp.]
MDFACNVANPLINAPIRLYTPLKTGKLQLDIPANNISWPIALHKQCHVGNWVERAKKEQVFDASWVQKLDKVHLKMHELADEIFSIYQQGQVVEARDKLKEMQIVFDKMTNVLGEWE